MSLPKPYYSDDAVTLYLGDSFEIIPLLPKCDIVFTDIPFAEETHKGARSSKGGTIEYGGVNTIDFDCFSLEDSIRFFSLCSGICDKWIISFIDWHHARGLEVSEALPLELVRLGAWYKPNPTPQITGDRPGTGWEAIAYMHKKGKKIWNGGGRSGSFNYQVEKNNRVHATQKPLGLIKQILSLFANPGDLLVDPCMGSGTMVRAGKDLGLNGIGIDKDEKNLEIAANRMCQEVLI
jgi:site-specific DNA-methyltransferase (adenine-specific)